MLKTQDVVSTPSVTVAQARVTPEELTEALAAIEVKRQAEASRLAGTIPLDQAVSELHLDSTSDEIWAEVQAQRVKAAAAHEAQTTLQMAQSPSQDAPVHPLGEIFQRIRALRQERQNSQTSPKSRRQRGLWRAFASLMFVWLLVQNGHLTHISLPALTINTHTASPAPILRTLAQEPDGKTVYADDAALVQISEGKSPSQITISENVAGSRWPLVKMAGHIYLHGYIASTDSLLPLQGKALKVYNDDNSGGLAGESTSKITLRVDQTPLQQSGGGDDYSEVTIPNFQPDPLTTLSDWR